MNRTEMVQALRSNGVADPEKAVDTMIDVMTVALASGEPISIRNFGKLQVRERASIVRKNPKTQELIRTPRRQTVTFTPAPAFKHRLNV